MSEWKRKYKKRNQWRTKSELLLLELWKSKIPELRTTRRNGYIMEEMAADLKEYGFSFNATQIKIKMQNMSSKFRKEQTKIGPPGRSSSDWRYFKQMNELLGNYKSYDSVEITEDNTNAATESSIEAIDIVMSPSASQALFNESLSVLLPTSPSPSPMPLKGATKNKSFRPQLLKQVETAGVDLNTGVDTSNINFKESTKKENMQQQLLKQVVTIGVDLKREMDKFNTEYKKVNKQMIEIEKKKTQVMEKYVGEITHMRKALESFLN